MRCSVSQPDAAGSRLWRSRSHTLSRLLHARVEGAGLPAARITGHSLRAGHTTAAYTAGVHLDRIAPQTRHKDLAVLLNRYIRPLDALGTTAETSACDRHPPGRTDPARSSPKRPRPDDTYG
jgi:integrase